MKTGKYKNKILIIVATFIAISFGLYVGDTFVGFEQTGSTLFKDTNVLGSSSYKNSVPTAEISISKEESSVSETKRTAPNNQTTLTASPKTVEKNTNPDTEKGHSEKTSNLDYLNYKDYSVYLPSLQQTLTILNNKLQNIQSEADNKPAEVDKQITSIDTELQSDLNEFDRQSDEDVLSKKRELGSRGISSNSGLGQQEIAKITGYYEAKKQTRISQAEYEKEQVRINAVNRLTELKELEIDTINKIETVNSLIAKINSGEASYEDDWLISQAINYR